MDCLCVNNSYLRKNKNQIMIKTFPKISTERLLLRKIEKSDGEVILYLRSDEVINKYIQRPEHRKTKNISDALEHIQKLSNETESNKSFSWGITLKDDPKIIGTICIWNFSDDRKKGEVGYDLNPAFQGKGIMSEALTSVMNFGFNELNLNTIEAFTHKENESSKRLLEKNGFNFANDRKDNDNLSNAIFEITRPNR